MTGHPPTPADPARRVAPIFQRASVNIPAWRLPTNHPPAWMPTVAITLTSDSIDGSVLCVSADPSDASGRRAGCVPMSTRPAPRPPRSNAFSASTTRRFCASSPPNSARNTRRAKSRRKRTCGSEPRPSRSCQVKEAVGGCPQVNLQTVDSAGPQQLGIASEVAACCARSSEPVMQREEDRYQLG